MKKAPFYIYTARNIYANYNKGNINNNNLIETNNGYQIMIKSKENQFSNNKLMSNTKNYGESNYSNSGQSESNYIDSKIVNYDDIIFLKNRIREIHPRISSINFNLVYRASEDGDKASDFHSKCDKIGPNITLIKAMFLAVLLLKTGNICLEILMLINLT